VIIGFVAMRIKLGKLNRYKLRIHDGLLTLTYLLLILSLPRMVNFTYFSIVHGNLSPLILTHSLVGIVVVVIGFIFVINKGSLKLKRAWKTKRNMQTLSVLWIMNFVLGIFVLGSLFRR
jgi:arginine exporter protein ArgO